MFYHFPLVYHKYNLALLFSLQVFPSLLYVDLSLFMSICTISKVASFAPEECLLKGYLDFFPDVAGQLLVWEVDGWRSEESECGVLRCWGIRCIRVSRSSWMQRMMG